MDETAPLTVEQVKLLEKFCRVLNPNLLPYVELPSMDSNSPLSSHGLLPLLHNQLPLRENSSTP